MVRDGDINAYPKIGILRTGVGIKVYEYAIRKQDLTELDRNTLLFNI